MTDAEFEAHVARNKALRQARRRPESAQPKPVPALLKGPQLTGAGAIEFCVPGVPIPKGRPRLGRGHAYTPKRTVEAENAVRSVAKLAEVIPLVGPLIVCLDFYLPIPKYWNKSKTQSAMLGTLRPAGRPDVDNLCKLVLDGLNEIAFTDDCQIVDLTCRKWYSIEPRTQVRIVPILE